MRSEPHRLTTYVVALLLLVFGIVHEALRREGKPEKDLSGVRVVVVDGHPIPTNSIAAAPTKNVVTTDPSGAPMQGAFSIDPSGSGDLIPLTDEEINRQRNNEETLQSAGL